jgi:hypothetical protein
MPSTWSVWGFFGDLSLASLPSVSGVAGRPWVNYFATGDKYRLAHMRDGIVLRVRAMREGLHLLRALGVPITLPKYCAVRAT